MLSFHKVFFFNSVSFLHTEFEASNILYPKHTTMLLYLGLVAWNVDRENICIQEFSLGNQYSSKMELQPLWIGNENFPWRRSNNKK